MNEINSKRYRFNDVFIVNNNMISPRIPVQIGGITMGPGVTFEGGVFFSGVDLSQQIGRDIDGYVENGVFVIKGFYQ